MTAAAARRDKVAYTKANAAVVADCSEKTIQRAIHSGELKAKKLGRTLRILHTDLVAWLEDLPDVDPGQ